MIFLPTDEAKKLQKKIQMLGAGKAARETYE
jgi:hypothetical protein